MTAAKTMAFETIDRTCVVVHTADPPSQEEWDAFVEEVKRLLERVGAERARNLVFTKGGGPSFSQRQKVNEVLKGRTPPAAVVTSNAFVRGIVAALAVFNPKIKTFRPEAMDDALHYLGLTHAESKAVWRTLEKLQGQLSIKNVG